MENGEIILYTTEDGKASVKLRAEGGTVWLTRVEISDLFQTTPQNITLHIQKVCEENEVDIEATSKDCLLVQIEGGRSVQRETWFWSVMKNLIREGALRKGYLLIEKDMALLEALQEKTN